MILALCFMFAGAASANPETQPDSRAHIIVGMTPNAQFAVTCDDSLLTPDPIESDELGILTFSTDENQEGSPVTIWVGTPAPPEISNVAACAVSDTLALICWNTDRPATSQVEFGTTDSYGSTASAAGGLTTIHAVYISPLEPETLYHYRAVSMDAFDNTTKSGDYTVVTDAPHLRISNFGSSDPTTHSITVNWTTSKPADSRVVYGLDHLYGNATPLDPEFVSEHSVVVDGLQPGITYHFRAWSTDGDGQTAVSVDGVAASKWLDARVE
ncbi:fibronectin type III domain-containing protein, partial [bacterium]|nr:fibronectin type III domain-containing protein [bacterium]